MNLFDVYALAHVLHQFTQVELGLLWAKMYGQGNMAVESSMKQKMEQAMDNAELICKYAEMDDCLANVTSAKHQWHRPLLDVSAGCEIAHRLQIDIIGALEKRQFLRVADDRLKMLLHARGPSMNGGIIDVFGPQVMTAFPSAEGDIVESGNCLAAECNTAAVFHLMRVAEVGLRALAADRKVVFANKPIDQQEWGTILASLDGVIKKLRESDAKNWPDPSIRDVQIRFYGEVVAELRQFNEAWRRHISHAREDAFYDHDYATSVFKHVMKFVQKLAEKIGELQTTPEYWTAK